MTFLQYFGAIIIFHLLLLAAMFVLILKNNMVPKKKTLDLIVICSIIAIATVVEFLFEYFFAEHLMSPESLEGMYPAMQIAFALVTFFLLRLMSYDRKYLFALAVPFVEVVLIILTRKPFLGSRITIFRCFVSMGMPETSEASAISQLSFSASVTSHVFCSSETKMRGWNIPPARNVVNCL